MDLSDWEDRFEFWFVVPISAESEVVYYPVLRQPGHMYLLGCIAVSGDSLTPMLLASEADEKYIYSLGYEKDEDIFLRYPTSKYVNEELFIDRLAVVLIPYLKALRQQEQYRNELAILMFDNMSAHVIARVLQLLAQHGVLVYSFPPHSIHLLQPLDLLLFLIFKTYQATERTHLTRGTVEGQIVITINAYEKAAISNNVH